MDALLISLVIIGATIGVPLIMAVILYLPLKAQLEKGRYRRKRSFILTHLGLSLLSVVPLIATLGWANYHCTPSPELPHCRDMGSSLFFMWLLIVAAVTLIISPIIANTMYAEAPAGGDF